MSNEPKEGIKAIATTNTTNRIYGKVTVNPVSNVVKANRYCEEDGARNGANQSFSGILQQEMERHHAKTRTTNIKQEQLRLMGGLNQYDRHAREFCFLLSTEADYKA